MEAMAAGLPVVAVDASGTRDIVEDGKQGLLVANDPQALAEAAIQVIESPEMMQRFSQQALEKAKTFEAGHQAKKLIRVYEQAIQDKAGEKFVRIE